MEVKSNAHRSDYVFGSRKRRRVPTFPYSSDYDGFSPESAKPLKLSFPGESVSLLLHLQV